MAGNYAQCVTTILLTSICLLLTLLTAAANHLPIDDQQQHQQQHQPRHQVLEQQLTQQQQQQQQLIDDHDQNSVDHVHGGQRQARIDAIKQDILAKLGLARVPDVSGINVTAAEKRHLLRMYRRSLEEVHGKTHVLFDDDQQQAKNFYSFTNAGHHPRTSTSHASTTATATTVSGSESLHFNIDIPEPDDARKETVIISATLKLYRHSTGRGIFAQNSSSVARSLGGQGEDGVLDDLLIVTICQRVEPIVGNEVQTGCRPVDTRVVPTTDAGWLDFDIADAVNEWVSDARSNFGLEVSVERQRSRGRGRHRETASDWFVIGEAASAAIHNNAEPMQQEPQQQQQDQTHLVHHIPHEHAPLLNIIAQERAIVPSSTRHSGRQRRQTGGGSALDEPQDCTLGDGETRCCRYPLWISFADIGWDTWVVAPDGYQAYYCYGRCPHRYKVAHNFANMRSLVNLINPRAVPAPTCSATKYSPLPIAHYRDGRQVVTIFEDMIVQTCKCV